MGDRERSGGEGVLESEGWVAGAESSKPRLERQDY
jgi:hypothetical protein